MREALSLSQAALAGRTSTLDQSYVARIEAGRNQASSFHVREALARGFGLSLQTFVAYLDGTAELGAVLAQVASNPSVGGEGVAPDTPPNRERVQIDDGSGRTIDVPLEDLIRAYHLIMEMGGFEAAARLDTRLSSLENSLRGREERVSNIERQQRKLDGLIAKIVKAPTKRK